MVIKRTLSIALVSLLAGGVAGGAALAQTRNQDGRDIAAVAKMKVTLQQAIGIAESQAGGRAVGADILHPGDTSRISVEVAGPQGIKIVIVDGATGQVTATRDGGNDAEDND